MPLKITKRQLVLTPLVFLLSVSVFAWGLQAKLSLYQLRGPSHPISVAKLLPDNQVNKRIGIPHSSDRIFEPHPPFLTAYFVFHAPVIILRRQQTDHFALLSIRAQVYSLFFRPPPSQA